MEQPNSKPSSTRKRKLEEISIELSDYEKSFGFNQVAQPPKKRHRVEQMAADPTVIDLTSEIYEARATIQ